MHCQLFFCVVWVIAMQTQCKASHVADSQFLFSLIVLFVPGQMFVMLSSCRVTTRECYKGVLQKLFIFSCISQRSVLSYFMHRLHCMLSYCNCSSLQQGQSQGSFGNPAGDSKDKCMELVTQMINGRIATLPTDYCQSCEVSSAVCKKCFLEWQRSWKRGWKLEMDTLSEMDKRQASYRQDKERMIKLTNGLLASMKPDNLTGGPCVNCHLVEGPCGRCLEKFLVKLQSDRLTICSKRILFTSTREIPLEVIPGCIVTDPRKKS